MGLEPLGQAWNSTTPTGAAKGCVPASIQSLFDQRMKGRGLGLRELAAFAATMLDFVHNEVLADVLDLYAALNLPTSGSITRAEADRIVQGYVLQVLDGNINVDIEVMEGNMKEWLPAYDDLRM